MADVNALMSLLTLEEKATLTAGGDFFATAAIDRVGIPSVRVTDGPNGARGVSTFPGVGGTASTCVPCGTAIGATWNPELAREVGAIVGREALDRGCRGLLAPTVNLHRSPLAGRNFECYSEDPLLTGHLAAAYIQGVQSTGVFATVKHFVGNEAEFERMTTSSVIDERSLRELYLLPFELAVKDGGVLGVMTSYNRLNGRWLTEQSEFLIDILRSEWGFQGLVMTDWFAGASTEVSLGAGLDLEMPGPGRALGSTLLEAVNDGRVDNSDLDAAVERLLTGLNRIGALDEPTPPEAPLPPRADDLALTRRAAAEAIVLLSNDGTLPVVPGTVSRVAVVGPHASRPRIMGGGSAGVIPHRLNSMVTTLAQAFGDGTEVVHARGCEVDLAATPIGKQVLVAPDGFDVDVFATLDFSGGVVMQRQLDELRQVVFNTLRQDWPEGEFSLRVRGTVVPEESGTFQLALAQAGQTKVFIDGDLVLDGVENPPPPGGSDFFGQASQELLADVRLEAGTPIDVVVEFANMDAPLAGFRVGFRTMAGEKMIRDAVAAATDANVAFVFVGTTEEWESEGRDRSSFELPGRQDELVRAVAAANPKTVVVVNAGAPVDLPWTDEVAAVLQCWFGGQEMAPAIADVLSGLAEPGGRLPTTIPVRIEHNPAYDNFPGENGEVRYGEGLFIGYRGYERRCIVPRFAFGYGRSYTTFDLGIAAVSASSFVPGSDLTVKVAVTNTGSRAGSQVVQCYVAPPVSHLVRPAKELKAFAKVWLAPGESQTVELKLDDRSFAYWDPGFPDRDAIESRIVNMMPAGGAGSFADAVGPGWRIDPGRYEVLIGVASDDIVSRHDIDVLDVEDEVPR